MDTVGKNETRIAEYIRNQRKEDELGEQMTMARLRAASNNPCAIWQTVLHVYVT